MKTFLKKSGLLLGSTLLACALAGCGSSDKEKFVRQTNDVKELRFSWWGNDERHLYTLDGLDLFQSQNPDIEVKGQYSIWNGYENRIKTYIMSHTEADIMQINFSWLEMFSPDGEGFYDLYKLKDVIHLDTYDEKDLKYGEINGKLNAVPISFNTYAVYHDKTLYDQYELELPTTWDDYFAAAEKMRADDIYPLGAVKKHIWCLLLSYYEQSTGKYVFSDEGEFLLKEEDVAYILEFYKKLLDEKVIISPTDFDRACFTKGTTASAIAWISDANNYCNSLKENGAEVEIGDYPLLPEAEITGQYLKPSSMYAISKNTMYPKAAARLLRFLISDEEMAELQGLEKGVPISKNALRALKGKTYTENFQYKANAKMMKKRGEMRLIIPAMENEDVINAFMQGADEYLYGKQELETCANRITADIQKLCK